MKTDSADFRERLLGAIERGLAVSAAGRRFGVGEATLRRWRRQRRETGSLAPRPRHGRPPRIGPAHAPALEAHVRAGPDATLAAHGATWAREHGVRLRVATMARALTRLGWPRKQSP